MSKRPFDPCRLDVAAFAEAAGELEGHWPLAALGRLADMEHREASAATREQAAWAVRGERRKTTSAGVQTWLHLSGKVRLPLVCQRCLQPVMTALDVRRSFLFVEGEAAAAELDAECEDDVLALSRELDLRELVEDEFLLSLPLVPKHDQCPIPLLAAPADAEPSLEPLNPFAALAALKGATGRG